MIEFNHEAIELHAILGYEDKDALIKAYDEEEGLGEICTAVGLLNFLITKEAVPMIKLLEIIYPDANLGRPSNIVEWLMPILLDAENGKLKHLLGAITMVAEGPQIRSGILEDMLKDLGVIS